MIHGQYGNPIFDLALENDLIVDSDRKLIDIGEDDDDGDCDNYNNELLNTMDVRLKDGTFQILIIKRSLYIRYVII